MKLYYTTLYKRPLYTTTLILNKMVKVTNIKYTEIPFESKDKNFQRCLAYVKSIDPDYKKYMPTSPKQRLTFELVGVTSDLANCIRRYLIDEMPVYSMHVIEEDIESDDRFILADFLKKNLELIPFSQDITDKDVEELNMSLYVENKTDDIISVYSSDIIVVDKKKKKLDNSKYFTTTIPIIKLRPNSKLDINNISIVAGTGKSDAGKFLLLSNLSYEILDVKPLVENKYSKTGQSSLNSNPQHFRIGITTHRNMTVKRVMPMCCNLIIRTIAAIKADIGKIKESDAVYFSDLIELETKGDVKFFHFKGEYWTIANIISRYCYLTFKDIQFVCSSIIHPSTEESIVKIRHNSSIKVLTSALNSIISDITIIKKSFQ
jgi:DNA-directed RNA polymerase subunit L